MCSHFPEFPALYDPPADVLRCVREIDSAADLLYFGWGKWYLVRFKPNREHIARAHRALAGQVDQRGVRQPGVIELLERWRTGSRFKANPGAFRRLYGRYLFWTLVRMGGRPIAEYDVRFIRVLGFEGIVDDFRCMEWMARNLSDQQVEAALNAEKDTASAEANAQMTDEGRGRDAWRYLFTRTHAATRYDNPERRRHRSGFTTVATIGADGIRRPA
jgi:hypothetical protein